MGVFSQWISMQKWMEFLTWVLYRNCSFLYAVLSSRAAVVFANCSKRKNSITTRPKRQFLKFSGRFWFGFNSLQPHWTFKPETKRHSVAGTSTGEPIHMSLQEVRTYLQALYSSSSDTSEPREISYRKRFCSNGQFVSTNINNNNNSNKYQSRSNQVENTQIYRVVTLTLYNVGGLLSVDQMTKKLSIYTVYFFSGRY